MHKWKYFLRTYFGFTQKETNGFIVLSGILFLLLLITICISKFYPESELTTKEDKEILSQLLAQTTNKSEAIDNKQNPVVTNDRAYQYFDPNVIEEAELVKLVGTKVAHTIVNFRTKGGRFRKNEDLLKIYGMSQSLYNSLQPWIRIRTDASKLKNVTKPEILTFDINTADTIQLQQLRGIGSVLAMRIIKFRDKLGGFYNESQFDEIYGLQGVALTELKEKTFIDNNFQPKKISINSTDETQLFSHPYIGKKLAYAILKYKKSKGRVLNLDELKNIPEIFDEVFLKMLPYITL